MLKKYQFFNARVNINMNINLGFSPILPIKNFCKLLANRSEDSAWVQAALGVFPSLFALKIRCFLMF